MPKKLDTILAEGIAEKNLIAKKDLERLLKEAEASKKNLRQLITEQRILSEKDILDIFAAKLKLSSIDMRNIVIDKTIIDKVPVKIASYYKFIPIDIKDRMMTIAVSSPLDLKTQDEIRAQLGYEIEMVLAPSDDIAEGFKKYYGFAADTLEKIIAAAPPTQPVSVDDSSGKVEDIARMVEDASVIKLVNQIILDAFRRRATDIHIEPYRQGLALRYRTDGLLYDANVVPEMRQFLSAIISRIKIMSNLNIVERRLPQDGRAVVKVQDQVLDLRISTLPTPYGESLVIRILPTQMLFSLEKLGLSSKDLGILEKLIQKPHGIIFVTGPTGSGKTTTLYACLSCINTKERKIITIEDPIEYEMSGITQIQVMPEIGLDFARGLRSMLRHDPDVMMVGEVRDLETAEIAIRVALTGHLVFSTLHTNDASSGITRLIDIGVEPYLISSSVEAFIAQRLIRVNCPGCKYEDRNVPEQLKEMIARDSGLKSIKDVKIFRGRGCSDCNFTGFFGRTAIYETILIDEAIKDLIINKTPSGQIKRVAVSRGMRTLRQDGWQKVLLGLTTPEEVMKVTSSEESEEIGEGYDDTILEPLRGDISKTSSTYESDRRAYVRLSSRVNLRYKAFKSQEELLKTGFAPENLSVARNISAGGLLFSSTELLNVGSILQLKIELPDAETPIECLARVVRVDEIEQEKNYNIAAHFLDITGADRARLNKYVQRGS